MKSVKYFILKKIRCLRLVRPFFILATIVVICGGIDSKSLSAAEIFFPELTIHFQNKSWQIPAFYLDKFEVSNKDYQEFVEKSGVRPIIFSESRQGENSLELPVVGVDWYDANLYCQFQGKRLPRYLELVRAAQGEFPRDYPFEGDFPSLFEAPFVTHAHRPTGTYPVSSFPELQSDEGVFNLSGNVAEWTADWSDEELREWKKVYGGSYISRHEELMVGSFVRVRPEENTIKTIGFRCAKDGGGFDMAGAGKMEIEELKQLVYEGGGEAQKSLVLGVKQIEVQQIREREEERDKEKRLAYMVYLSRQEWERRLVLVKEARELVEQPIYESESPMIGIPYGYFWLGEDGLKNASPRHLVYTDKFDIQKRPVLKEELQAHLEKRPTVRTVGGSEITSSDGATDESVSERFTSKDFARVSYQNARNYCQAKGMDLPTEAQWEKSVRGPGDKNRVQIENGLGQGHYGVIGVGIGNSEWIRDYFGPYQPEKTETGILHAKNPFREKGFFPVVRGQGNLSESFARISARRIGSVLSSHAFRCVKEFANDLDTEFKLDPEWNYLTLNFIENIEKEIEKGVNVFNISWTEKDFAIWARKTYNE